MGSGLEDANRGITDQAAPLLDPGDFFLGRGAAEAAGRAAEAQQASAARQHAQAMSIQRRTEAIGRQIAGPRELSAMGSAINKQRNNLRKQQQLFDALDPAILEASQQALDILQGKESKFLQPMRQQRERQRQTLLNSLREQLGPGAETSTAGIQALTRFDQETASSLSAGQQQSLGQLFGMGQAGAQGRTNLGANIGQLGQLGAQASGLRLDSMTRANPFLASTSQGVTQTAGGQFVGEGLKQQGMMSGGQQGAGIIAGLFSDRRMKERIEPAGPNIDEFLGSLSAHAYEYKDPEHGEGKHVSVMAQDLAKTELGKSMVERDEQGRLMVNYAKGFGIMLAANVHLHDRLKRLEDLLCV